MKNKQKKVIKGHVVWEKMNPLLNSSCVYYGLFVDIECRRDASDL